MSLITLLLVILIIAVLFGGFGYDNGAYRNHGLGFGGLLVVVLVILLLTGRV